MKRALILVLILATVAGCGRLGLGERKSRIDMFDGQTFRGAARFESRQDRADFTATARPVSRSLDGAVQAAEYQGIRHCLRYYGTSNIVWRVGPDTAREALPIDGDTVVLAGRCIDQWAEGTRR